MLLVSSRQGLGYESTGTKKLSLFINVAQHVQVAKFSFFSWWGISSVLGFVVDIVADGKFMPRTEKNVCTFYYLNMPV